MGACSNDDSLVCYDCLVNEAKTVHASHEATANLNFTHSLSLTPAIQQVDVLAWTICILHELYGGGPLFPDRVSKDMLIMACTYY
jgi:hypothetical protein